MVNLYADLQRKVLVVGLQDTRALVPFADIFAGENLSLTLWAVSPSGDPGNPFAVQALTAALVVLSTVTAGIPTQVASSATWAVSGNQLVGALAIPSNVVFPPGQQFLAAKLSLDLTTTTGTTHIETACTLRNPSFPVTQPPAGTPTVVTLSGASPVLLLSAYGAVATWTPSAGATLSISTSPGKGNVEIINPLAATATFPTGIDWGENGAPVQPMTTGTILSFFNASGTVRGRWAI